LFQIGDIIIADTEELRSFLLSKGIDPARVLRSIPGAAEMFDGADGSRVRDRSRSTVVHWSSTQARSTIFKASIT